MNPIYLIDFYKVGHVSQYPTDVTQVWSNWTPRSCRIPGQKSVVHFGLQYFIKKYLLEEFEKEFFSRSLEKILLDYHKFIKETLGVPNPRTDHIEALHNLGYLPLAIYSIPEGDSTPLNCPSLVITNTRPEMYWLPNYLETILSAILWKPSTSATTAQRYRNVFLKYMKMAGETDLSFVDWMGHDFSMRGMSGVEDAALSGMGHLLSFSGTDSIPAILTAHKYYGAEFNIGGSVPATEHSVMCAGEKDGEYETFRRLIEDIYPEGVVSIVSDTWDLWQVLTDYMPRLKESILRRKGKVVIRPDSGDPVKILCGDPEKKLSDPARHGVIRLLAETFGTTNGVINNAGAIYGDSITVERAEAILDRIVNEIHLSPTNCVFGIGSFTYELVTRDTCGFAMKATAVRKNGQIVPIFKSPITDNGGKNSAKGIPTVFTTGHYPVSPHNKYFLYQESSEYQLDHCALRKVFEDGKLLIEDDFETIRRRVRS